MEALFSFLRGVIRAPTRARVVGFSLLVLQARIEGRKGRMKFDSMTTDRK
jgi:hypothetical protein